MLESIKGIGPKTLSILNKMDIYTIDDLINYYPYRYNILEVTKLKDGPVTITGMIESPPIATYIKRNLNKITFRVQIENYLVNVTMFNRAFLKTSLRRGMEVTLIGEYDEKHNSLVASDIRLKKIDKTTIEPIYHLTSGITSRTLHTLIMNSIDTVKDSIDFIPDYICDDYDFQDKMTALKLIHNPQSMNLIKNAIARFKYEELFKFMFKVNYLKLNRKSEIGLKREVDTSRVNEYIKSLPFDLTTDQKKAIDEIIEDLHNTSRMNRLILGDVGSGKTVVAVAAIYYNYLSNYQSALLVPTEILANQHFLNISKMLAPFNIRVELLKGGMNKREKNKLLEDLKNGEIDLLITTHAVLESNVEFHNLGLVITDEQHRFGVNQRSAFQNKGQMSDVLYMSATPIPRTYALTIYGDMDISLIKTKPSGRREINTKLVTFKDIKKVLGEMLEEIKNSHQIYVVCPMIEEDEESPLMDVETLEKKINEAYNNKIPVEILHGKLKNDKKEEIMSRFKNGSTKILISTTVIEVGVDVSNATMMVIFNAERFGLATLHQLRGRIGRNSLESKCILISDKDTERLKVLTESNDGFYISEQDYRLRGEGDLFGHKQSGEIVFKIANLKTDMKILTQANIDSSAFIKKNIDDNFQKYPQFLTLIEKMEHLD